MPNPYDVVVVGAGPAGCTAACDLAQGGAKTLLIEKAKLPRYKTCGGGLLRRAYAQLDCSLDGVVERTFDTIQLNLLDHDLHFIAKRTEPIVYMTMRADLDHHLAQTAREAGAELRDQCEVLSLREQNDHVELTTSESTITCRAVIAADGANSTIARLANFQDGRHLIPALEYEIEVDSTEMARRAGDARFDFGVIDAGYAWIFPKRNHLSAGILTTQRMRTSLHDRLAKYLARIGITHPTKIEKHGYTIPITPRKTPLAKGKIFLTGDAAGLADPVTAEGITHAIQSARLAARAILAHPKIETATADYCDAIQSTLLKELRAARLLARLLYNWPTLRATAFRAAGQHLCEFMTDVVTGTKTYEEAITTPSNYLKALGLFPPNKSSK